MQEILKNIKNYKHIVITVPEDDFIGYLASANALYTYFLQLHKKISLYKKNDDFGLNLDFLPWIDKVKTSYPSSADIEIKALTSIELFEIFESEKIKLNKKMALSLYAGLVYETNGFRKTDSSVFLMAHKLLEIDIESDMCYKSILDYQTLSSLRLKAILLKKMILQESGSLAYFKVDDADLDMSGAKLDDVDIIIQEALSLPTVTKVKVVYKNNIIRSQSE